jgi:hypothetical protein
VGGGGGEFVHIHMRAFQHPADDLEHVGEVEGFGQEGVGVDLADEGVCRVVAGGYGDEAQAGMPVEQGVGEFGRGDAGGIAVEDGEIVAGVLCQV